MKKIIVVGSGPTGVMASRTLLQRNAQVTMIDIGYTPTENDAPDGNLYDHRKKDLNQYSYTIGSHFEGINITQSPINVRLKSPAFQFVTRSSHRLLPIQSKTFSANTSFAQGGLANAWGAICCRYNDDDLAGTPLKERDLEPYYDALTSYMGISGAEDDLSTFFGSSKGLLPHLKIEQNTQRLLQIYQSHRKYFHAMGFYIGYPRMAVLSQDHRGRPAIQYDNMEFWKSHNNAIYYPSITLKELLTNPHFCYIPHERVIAFDETSHNVVVLTEHVENGMRQRISADKLILAAGTFSTTKIVLTSKKSYRVRVNICDNPVSLTPFVNLRRIGAPLEKEAFGLTQLCLVYNSQENPRLQGNIYSYTTPLRSDTLLDFPLSLNANIRLAKNLFPAFIALQLFYPSSPSSKNYLQLLHDGKLDITYERYTDFGTAERKIIRALRRFGFISHPGLIQTLQPGGGSHYTGTIPMSLNPSGLTVNENGQLHKSMNVYIVDGSILPDLPAKNYTFFLMANAMRVADKIPL